MPFDGDYLFDHPPHIQSTGQTNETYYREGYLNALLYHNWNGNPVDPTGSNDSTSALQKWLDDAVAYKLTAYLPAGTYRITRPLHFVKGGAGLLHRHSTVLQGPVDGARPLLQLSNNNSQFQNPSTHNAVLFVWERRERITFGASGDSYGHPEDTVSGSQNAQFATGYLQRVSRIRIDCGSGNPGAIGLYFRAAQDSHVEDVRVDAYGAYAGFWGLPARTSAGGINLEANGGQYGVYLDQDAGTHINNLVCRDQTVMCLRSNHGRPTTVVGFDFQMANSSSAISGFGSGGEVVATTYEDGIIRCNGGTAIDANNSALYFRDVYVTGTNNVISYGGGIETASGTWKRINEFVITGSPSQSLIEGNIGSANIIDITSGSSDPPSGHLSKHTFGRLPFFTDSDCLNARDLGVYPTSNLSQHPTSSNCTTALQSALNTAASQERKIFFPKGEYEFASTISVPAGTKMFGLSRAHTSFTTHISWQPGTEQAMFETVDSATAEVFMAHFGCYTQGSGSGDRHTIIHWRCGDTKSKAIGIFQRHYPDGGGTPTQERNCFKVTGNGAGKFYFLGEQEKSHHEHPSFRALLISGTSGPFSIYGWNTEKVDSAWQCEIQNSSNIRIYGCKIEGNTNIWLVNNSTNVAIHGVGKQTDDSANIANVRFTGTSNNNLCSNVMPDDTGDPGTGDTVQHTTGVGISYKTGCSIYKHGTLDDDAMFPDEGTDPPPTDVHTAIYGMSLTENMLQPMLTAHPNDSRVGAFIKTGEGIEYWGTASNVENETQEPWSTSFLQKGQYHRVAVQVAGSNRTVAQWKSDIEAALVNLRSSFFTATEFFVIPEAGGPSDGLCPRSGPGSFGGNVLSSHNHPNIQTAGQQIEGEQSDVYYIDLNVDDCAWYSDAWGHLTSYGGQQIGEDLWNAMFVEA
ncbi:MAG: hypothetical protein HKM94_04290, partial [Halobacteria archaeon]|nr:hypothetical protein [Halobacteria archaeon]